MIRELLKRDFAKVLNKLEIPSEKLVFDHPQNSSFGDFSTNIAMKHKNPEFKSPVEWANEIVNTWRSMGLPSYVGKVDVVMPGFINISFKEEALIAEMEEVLKLKDDFGKQEIGKGKTLVIDYSAPNIAKPFGIGHLRSTDIGQAIYNLYKALGWQTIGDNHLGDWGTQFGKLIWAIKKWERGSEKLDLEKLEKLYVKFHQEAIEHPEMEDEARAWFKKLEDKDPEAVKIWKKCIEISLEEYQRIYDLLDVKIDNALGESFYEEKMQEVLEDARKKSLLTESQGAQVIPLPGFEVPLILLKSDGATTYETRELATIKYRQETWQPDLIVWEVGADQKFHFQRVFAGARLLGYDKKTEFVHVPHGLIRWQDGKFSTREGKTIHLEEVLDEAIKRAEEIIANSATDRGLKESDKREVAEAVGIGAVKYSDLKQNPQTDIVFSWDRIFNLEGDSGPYLQYTYARMKSVLSKQQTVNSKQQEKLKTENWKLETEELEVLRTLYRFPEVIEEGAKNFAPNLVCAYLFDLAQKYNLLYNKLPILKSEGQTQTFRLKLTEATAIVLKNGLNLLGIKTLERM